MTRELEPVAPTRQRVQSVSRALAILREVAAAEGLTVQEISRRVGLRPPTTYHLVHTLADEGFLARGERGRYRLGSSVGSLAQAFRRQIAPPAHLLPHLRSVGLRTGEASHIVGWSNGEIMVLGQVPGRHPVSVTEFAVGTVGDAHARSSGKLLLAFADAETRAEYLRLHPPRRRTRGRSSSPPCWNGSSSPSASAATPSTSRSTHPASAAWRRRSTSAMRSTRSRCSPLPNGSSGTSMTTSLYCSPLPPTHQSGA